MRPDELDRATHDQELEDRWGGWWVERQPPEFYERPEDWEWE